MPGFRLAAISRADVVLPPQPEEESRGRPRAASFGTVATGARHNATGRFLICILSYVEFPAFSTLDTR